MKNQALFSSKDKSKTLKCRLLQFLFGALRVKLVSASKLSNSDSKAHERLCYLYPNFHNDVGSLERNHGHTLGNHMYNHRINKKHPQCQRFAGNIHPVVFLGKHLLELHRQKVFAIILLVCHVVLPFHYHTRGESLLFWLWFLCIGLRIW